ncbi:MAG: hypothetical protein DRI70_04755 [Bacteroidetes bacterium]|nr:MAG: hypothetical protein DRI70_04755 [Bacteroidota bacterium]
MKIEFSVYTKIRIIQTMLVILTCHMGAIAQGKPDSEEKQPFSSKIYMSYIFGAQIYNDNVLYNPGVSVLFTQSYSLSGNIDLGVGSGYTSMGNERFVPFYLEAYGFKKMSSNSPIIKFQFGYSAAWYKNTEALSDYNLNGGIYFSAGMGRQIPLNNRYSLLFHWSYCHQSGKVDYQIFGNQDYSEQVNYDMIKISIGFIRKNY